MSDKEPLSFEQVGLAAALAKTYGENQRDFLPFLAAMLEKALLPGQVIVKRKPVSLFSSQTKVVSISLTIDDDMYEAALAKDGFQLMTTYKKVVRGITIKTENPSVHVWLKLVSDRLQELAAQNERTHTALADFMEFRLS